MQGTITGIRLSLFDPTWSTVTIDHGPRIPDTQMTIPTCESREWVLGDVVNVTATDAEGFAPATTIQVVNDRYRVAPTT